MIPETFLSVNEESNLHVKVWSVENPRAVLQITHGMSEYIERYDAFARYLNENGILVVGHDHMGHGQSADPRDYGYFGMYDGWKRFTADVDQLYKIVREEYPDVPYFLMGHSMGSFVARSWFTMYKEKVDGIIFMGTAGENRSLGAAGVLVTFLRIFLNNRTPSKLMTALAFGNYNYRIPNAKTKYDWLTRDEKIVDAYINDPACGFYFSLAGYKDLFNMLAYINDPKWYSEVPADVPVLVVSGTEDPVGNYGNGPAEVAEKLQEAGCEDVSLLLYDGMRHEVLNEIGKETVMEDIKKFILDEECEGQQEEA